MKTYRQELWFETRQRRELINITATVDDSLRASGIRDGLLLCNAMHITASVFINDDEPGLHQDFEVWLEGLAPEKPYTRYHHNGSEDNADTIGEAGIIFTPAGDYILVIFLDHPDQLVWEPSSKLVADLSRAVYNYYTLPQQ